jgi:CRP-like cAMP-binding protein
MPAANKSFKKGSFLFRENDNTTDMYILQSGMVRVFRKDSAKEVDICQLGKGSVFGEMAMIDGRPRSASVQALEDSEVSILTADDFSKKTQSIPAWFFTIMKIVIRRLRDSNKRLHSAYSQNNAGNIAAILQLVYKKHQVEEEGKKVVDLKFAKKEIINILNIPHGELNDKLDDLVKARMISIEKNKIYIPEAERFGRYAHYLRIQSIKAEEGKANLTEGARKLLIFINNNKTKYGKAGNKGLEFSLEASASEVEAFAGKDIPKIVEELAEKEFLTSEASKGEKDKKEGKVIL